MQEGRAELGAGHEDSVSQEEITEECLCSGGREGAIGGRWDFIGQAHGTQVHAQLECPSPEPTWSGYHQRPAPVTALPTQANNSSGMRTSC